MLIYICMSDSQIIIKEIAPFITSIYHTNIGDNSDILTNINLLSTDKTNYKEASNAGGWHSQVYSKHDLTGDLLFVNPIVEKILPIVQIIYNEIGIKKTVSVNGFWFIKNTLYNYNKLHNHPGCWISGVVYLKVPKNSGQIVFERPDIMHDVLPIDTITDKSTQEYFWNPVPGDVLLFPSYLKHYVEQNLTEDSDNERIVMSINFK